MNTTPRVQITVAGAKSGGKIAKRRRYAAAKTPYKRRRSQSPKKSGIKRRAGDILSGTSRMIAKGAMKFLTFMTDTDYISSSSETEDEDDVVSCDADVYASFEVSKWKEKDSTSTEMSRMSPKWVIGKLLLWETFSREESDKLIEIINSRVVDCFPLGEVQGAGLMETPSGKSGTHDRCTKAVMQENHWLEEKKVESSSKAYMDHGPSAFGSFPLQHACLPWASPSLSSSGLRTPSPMATDHFKDKALSTIGGSSFPYVQKRGTLSARSWNIQDEVRKVRFKAAEDMLHALPSKRNGPFVVSEHETFQNSAVPGVGSTVDKIHVSKSLPEEDVEASIKFLAGPSTIHDFKDSFALGLKHDVIQAEPLSSNPSTSVSQPNQHLTVEGATTTDSYHSLSLEHLVKQHNESDANSEDEFSRRYDARNSEADDATSLASLISSLRSRLLAGIEHNPKQSNSKPSTAISVQEIDRTAEGSQELQNSTYKVAIKNSAAGNEVPEEMQREKKAKDIQRKACDLRAESDANSEVEISRRYDARNSEADDHTSLASLRSSLRSRLLAGIEHNPKQSNSKPSTAISVQEIDRNAKGSQELQNSTYKVAIKNSAAGNEVLEEKQREKKAKDIQRKGKGKGK